jgi:LmbE family N-acetylglucosaminyl deacetylase
LKKENKMAFFKLKKNVALAADKILGGKLLKMIAPVPDLEKCRRALFIGPHPDDIEIGAGGTLHKFVKAGKAVKMLICTDGGAGSTDATLTCEKIAQMRWEEAQNAAKVHGVTDIENLGYPDGGVYDMDELAAKIAKVIYDFAPDLVLCPDPHLPTETHPDHIKCAQAAVTAVTIASNYYSGQRHGLVFEPEKIIPMRKIAYYYTHRANVFVALSEEDVAARLNSLKCHKSQMSGALAEGLAVYLSVRDKYMAQQVTGEADEKKAMVKAAEGFFAMAPLHQHCVSEVNDW